VPCLLFLATALTTTTMGSAMAGPGDAFLENPFAPYAELVRAPWLLLRGLSFSVPLLAILLAHEMGHYGACRRYRMRATLPHFLPAPTLIGTFGAFIRIRSPIAGRRELIVVGAAGPLLGLAVCIPVLFLGMPGCETVVVPDEVAGCLLGPGDIPFGRPLILCPILDLWFGPLGAGEALRLGPAALAGWFGLLVTALNLFPAGQLDGGHVVYGLAPRWHRPVSWAMLLVVLFLGVFFWPGWLFWGLVMAVMGARHPRVYDEALPPLAIRGVGALCLLLFPLCLTPMPIRL